MTETDLDRLLPTADVLISILPATADTVRTLHGPVFDLLPSHAWVVNVGRGSTLDEKDLISAVRAGRIAGAALDVFETEPLPVDSGLWDEPNVIISPHAAGGRPLGAATLIEENVAAFVNDRPLRNRVA